MSVGRSPNAQRAWRLHSQSSIASIMLFCTYVYLGTCSTLCSGGDTALDMPSVTAYKTYFNELDDMAAERFTSLLLRSTLPSKVYTTPGEIARNRLEQNDYTKRLCRTHFLRKRLNRWQSFILKQLLHQPRTSPETLQRRLHQHNCDACGHALYT